jgi:hypothetical protein
MSIHRPKRATSRRSESPSAAGRASSPSSAPKPPKWKDVVGDKPDAAFAAYAPALTFTKDALVNHSKFGKGVVVEVDGNKLHVLFEEGIRKLLHGTPG